MERQGVLDGRTRFWTDRPEYTELLYVNEGYKVKDTDWSPVVII